MPPGPGPGISRRPLLGPSVSGPLPAIAEQDEATAALERTIAEVAAEEREGRTNVDKRKQMWEAMIKKAAADARAKREAATKALVTVATSDPQAQDELRAVMLKAPPGGLQPTAAQLQETEANIQRVLRRASDRARTEQAIRAANQNGRPTVKELQQVERRIRGGDSMPQVASLLQDANRGERPTPAELGNVERRIQAVTDANYVPMGSAEQPQLDPNTTAALRQSLKPAAVVQRFIPMTSVEPNVPRPALPDRMETQPSEARSYETMESQPSEARSYETMEVEPSTARQYVPMMVVDPQSVPAPAEQRPAEAVGELEEVTRHEVQDAILPIVEEPPDTPVPPVIALEDGTADVTMPAAPQRPSVRVAQEGETMVDRRGSSVPATDAGNGTVSYEGKRPNRLSQAARLITEERLRELNGTSNRGKKAPRRVRVQKGVPVRAVQQKRKRANLDASVVSTGSSEQSGRRTTKRERRKPQPPPRPVPRGRSKRKAELDETLQQQEEPVSKKLGYRVKRKPKLKKTSAPGKPQTRPKVGSKRKAADDEELKLYYEPVTKKYGVRRPRGDDDDNAPGGTNGVLT